MITEDYVSFEVANLLKKKGFNELIGFVYSENGELMKLSDFGVRYLSNSECDDYPHWQFPIEGVSSIVSAPTIQMAMKWLREVHNYDICICLDSYVEPYDNQYYILIRRRKDKYENISPCEQVYFDTYEEAAETAIKYCLENLI